MTETLNLRLIYIAYMTAVTTAVKTTYFTINRMMELFGILLQLTNSVVIKPANAIVVFFGKSL